MESAPLSSGSSSSDAEYVLGLSQPLPLGDRLTRARTLAEAEQSQAIHQLGARGREVDRRVRGAFGTALYAQRVATLQGELLDISQGQLELAEFRRAAGELLASDLAELRQREALDRIDLDRSASLAEQTRAALGISLGIGAEVSSVTGDLAGSLELPALDDLLARLDAAPALLAVEAGRSVARARLELAEELRTPDVRLDLFYRRLNATETNALDIGLAIPLRARATGRARVFEEQARAVRANAIVDSTRLQLESSLRDAHARARHALQRVATIKRELLARAEQRADTVQRRRDAGDVAQAEVLDARRAVLELRLAQLAGMHEALTAWADLSAFLEAAS